MSIRFLLICDGSSDAALITHITRLILTGGHSDPQGQTWYRPGRLAEKIRDGLEFSGGCDLLLVHRDAEASRDTRSAGPGRRYDEIESAVREAGFDGPYAGIVPVRMTESWLLLDEPAIREIAGWRAGVTSLNLPAMNRVEHVADPKDRLWQALIIASGTTGRRRWKFERDLPALRSQLLQNLPPGGLLERVPSWVRFRDDLIKALDSLGSH